MKKIVAFFLIISSILTFTKNYIQTDLNEFIKIEQLEQKLGMAFTIPDIKVVADPDVIYPLLVKSATDTNVNLFRSSINNKPNNEVEIVKYVLLTTKTNLYQYIHLSNGAPLTAKDMLKNTHYLSTLQTRDSNQVGTIIDFANNNLISVKPMQAAYQYLPVAGTYYVETSDPHISQKFISAFIENINSHFNSSFTIDLFKSNKDNSDVSRSSASITTLTDVQNTLTLIILLLMVYSIFHQSKTIGIYKLHGISNIRIWFKIIGKTLLITGASSLIISSLICPFIPNAHLNFLLSTTTNILITYISMLTVSFIPYAYISKLKLHHMVKNRKNTTLILSLNTLTKVVCSVLLIILVNQINHQNIGIKEYHTNVKEWEQNKNYGVFYPLYIGYDEDDLSDGSIKFNSVTANRLYPILNKMGSLFIDAREYEELALILNKNYKGIRTITVNNNYLKQYPIYDINHKQVQIEEEESHWIILIPQKYRDRESSIVDFFENNRNIWGKYEQSNYNIKVPEYLKKQPIKIIWLSDNQNIFSFNPDVFPTEKYSIIDPIIEVVTENNSFTSDRNGILGNGGTDPLKIKLIEQDTAITYKTLLPTLRNLKLDDNLKTLVTVNEYMLLKINQLNNELKLNLILLGGLLVGFLLLIIQHSLVLYSRYQKTFIVRRLFGLSFIRTYKEFILFILTLWIIQSGTSLLLVRDFSYSFYFVIMIVVGLELIVSIISIYILEEKNIIQMSKGEML